MLARVPLPWCQTKDSLNDNCLWHDNKKQSNVFVVVVVNLLTFLLTLHLLLELVSFVLLLYNLCAELVHFSLKLNTFIQQMMAFFLAHSFWCQLCGQCLEFNFTMRQLIFNLSRSSQYYKNLGKMDRTKTLSSSISWFCNSIMVFCAVSSSACMRDNLINKSKINNTLFISANNNRQKWQCTESPFHCPLLID